MYKKVDIAVKNSCKTIGEGPHWEESSQSLLYVDMNKGHIHRYKPETDTDEILDLGVVAVSTIIPCTSGGYIINQGSAIKHLDWESKTLTTVAEIDPGLEQHFNDAKCDAKGRYWTGTYSRPKDPTRAGMPKPVCDLYCMDNDQSLTKKQDRVTLSNGIVWSLDNTVMYYIDSFACCLVAYDYNLNTGGISNKRTVYKLSHCWGFMDGMTIDADGMLWLAVCGAGKVLKLDPNTGKELESITTPGAMFPTSCCFGGKDYTDLYITSIQGLPGQEDRPHEPTAGSLFRVRGQGLKGVPAHMCGVLEK